MCLWCGDRQFAGVRVAPLPASTTLRSPPHAGRGRPQGSHNDPETTKPHQRGLTSRFSADEVAAIRAQYAAGATRHALSEEYRTGFDTIEHIVTGEYVPRADNAKGA